MTPQEFTRLMQPVISLVGGKAVDAGLEEELNRALPPQSEAFRAIEAACHEAIEEGWMCNQGGEGRRFGRVIEPAAENQDLSVDVVDLTDVVGPHHRHPTGEVCMVMPVDEEARFDNHDAGWCINPPGSAHHPTVTGGRALVLYLLPRGEIVFTG
jgi:hypothetical protein